MNKDKEKKPYKCIYNQQLAGYLMMNKQPLQRMERNLDLPWRNVFLFNDTEEVEQLMLQYKQMTKENKNDYFKNCKSENYIAEQKECLH